MLNFKDSDECRTYVTSDTHFNHNPKWDVPIWKSRGYESSDEHTNEGINNINKIVRPNDNLIHIGDVCLNTTLLQFDGLISRINCQNIYLLNGNHNNPHYKNVYIPLVKNILGTNYTSESEVYPLRYKNIIYIGHYAEIILNGTLCVLFHYPISIWNHMSHGSWHLCGHSHYAYPGSQAECSDGKCLDVGVDGHGNSPWSLQEIAEVMATKKVVGKGDHHQ